LRILATVERYAPAIGGAERVVQRVAEGLAARGHELHVLTGGAREELELNGVRVHRVPLSGNEARGISGDPSLVLETIARVAPELVFNYAAQTWATDCCFALLERERRPRMVLAPCGFSGLGKRRYRRYFKAMPERLRRYDALILHSAVYQDWRFAKAAGAEPIVVIPNGADPPAAPEGSRDADSTERLAVTIGSHVLSKGHAQFARSVRALARERELVGAIVAPPRHGVDALRGCQLSCSLRARRGTVRLIDGSAPRAVAQALAAADLFLFTSRVECAPLVILEAMAAGTPWVSFDVGNVSELDGGIVAGGPRELNEAAGEILDGRRPELGPQGRTAWETNHRWEDVVGRYESTFQSVLGVHPARALNN
jgi:glycosyltransferase involved in cell wall biosynthesis